MSGNIEVPVLIVGGGPIGLGLALDLGWRGVRCHLIEQGDGTIHHPKMGLMNVRTMEHVRRWGLVERVHNGGFPDDYGLSMTFCTSVGGYLLGREEYPSMRDTPPPPESPERRQRGSQLWFDPLIAAAAREYPQVSMRYQCKLDGFEQNGDHVVAHVTDAKDGPSDITARYMVACDGAGSSVRQALGITMVGNPVLSQSVAIFFRSPELYKMNDKGDTERFIFIGREGTWGNLTAIDGRELWRLTILGSKDRSAFENLDAHREIRDMVGFPFPYELLSVLPWRRSQLVASSYGKGRVFAAGDAVHTMSPTGGFGMNTGIGDIVDLAWKMTAMLEGWGGPKLLDSYDAERRPIGHRNVQAATNSFGRMISATNCSAILDDTPEGERTRQEVGSHIKDATRIEWESMGVQLGYRYEDSPICVPDGSPPPPDEHMDYVPTARPGSRAPHVWLALGKSILDFFGRGFVLLRFGRNPPDADALRDAAAKRSLPFEIVDIENEEAERLYERRLVLVRPDGHVAWRADAVGNDTLAIIDKVRGA